MADTETQPTEAELEQAEQNVPEPPDEDHGDAHDPDEDPRDEAKREAIKYRRQLRAVEKANDDLRAENERLRQQIVEHEARAGDSAWRAAFVGAQVELAAAKRPSMVTKLIPTDPLKQLETPEAIVTGAEAAVAETLAEAPELKGMSDGSLVTQGARSQPPAVRAQTPDQWFREQRRRR
jgi:hypothetical protein